MSTRLNDIANEIGNLAYELADRGDPELSEVAIALHAAAQRIRAVDRQPEPPLMGRNRDHA